MRSLQDVLRNCFIDVTWGYGYRHASESAQSGEKYMVIPLNGDALEVPVFALHTLLSNSYANTKDVDALVVQIDYAGSVSTYKSLDARFRDTMAITYGSTRLLKLDNNGSDIYYSTCGTVFNKDFEPIMMLTWEFTKDTSEMGEEEMPYRWKFARPILRIAPEVLKKSNPVERYIVNRILSTIVDVGCTIYPPYRTINGMFVSPDISFRAKVIIDENPFKLREVDKPSISTTNESLLAIAYEHIEELVK